MYLFLTIYSALYKIYVLILGLLFGRYLFMYAIIRKNMKVIQKHLKYIS